MVNGETKRYCLVCKRMTIWRYNPAIRHSKCSICHSRSTAARKFDPKNPKYEEYKREKHGTESTQP